MFLGNGVVLQSFNDKPTGEVPRWQCRRRGQHCRNRGVRLYTFCNYTLRAVSVAVD